MVVVAVRRGGLRAAAFGGSYRFTDEHVTEIVRRFEVAPLSDIPTAPSTSPVPRRRPQAAETTVPQLTARPPRRARQHHQPSE
jgi:hypothetical protein